MAIVAVPILFVFPNGRLVFRFSDPAVDYMQGKGLPQYLIDKLKPLGYDYFLDPLELEIIDEIIQFGDYAETPSVEAALDSIIKDGKVTGEEVYLLLELDTDHDYVSDLFELTEYNTDYASIDSDGGGIDDFNEIFTYELNPNNPQDDREFLKELPNVIAKFWNQTDGGVPDWDNINDRYITISLRDPLIQWLAEHSEIRSINFEGIKTVLLYVNGELIDKGGKSLGTSAMPPPSYFFTHGRTESCVPSSLAHVTILRAMGYKAILVSSDKIKHQWVEAYIDGEVYVVDHASLRVRAEFYQTNNDFYPTNSDFGPDYSYDPDWYMK